MGWTSVVTTVLGGALYAVNPTYPFVALVALNGLGLLVLFTLPPDRTAGDDSSPSEPERVFISDTLSLLRRRFASRALRSFVIYVGLFFAVISAADGYIQPVARDLFEPTLRSASVAGGSLPLGVVLGLLYAGLRPFRRPGATSPATSRGRSASGGFSWSCPP